MGSVFFPALRLQELETDWAPCRVYLTSTCIFTHAPHLHYVPAYIYTNHRLCVNNELN